MIDIIIPTYKRPQKIKKLIKNIYQTSTKAIPTFIIHPSDIETKKILDEKNQKYIVTECEYMDCINLGVLNTDKEFIFCGADDILFTKGWDKKLLDVMKDEKIMVTGGIDDWIISKSGLHTSHPLVRRSYLGKSYWKATTNDLYNPNYTHYMGDIELEQLAHTKGVIKVCEDCIVHHNHFVNQKEQKDETYIKSGVHITKDTEIYNERKHAFECYSHLAMGQGHKAYSQFHRLKHTIVMPIWNCKDYVVKTLQSLIEKTQHKYELIMIDDNSTEFDGQELLTELKEMAYNGGFTDVIAIVNKEQKYCNYNWNKGVELATGDYISIINSDIEFLTDEWDDYLIENVDLGYQLVNPYQVDRIYKKAYSRAPNKKDVNSNVNIRGACFMMPKSYAKTIFPIPKKYKHWCGDNYISYNTQDIIFDIRVIIKHYISKSGEKVDQRKFWKMVREDVKNWVEDTDDLMSQKLLENCNKRVECLI